ncbi:MAG TPA: ATP-binding protein [Methylomirabilota bacterium]|jgi:two-component system, NtrC family, sensor histidine kinase GlrK|nr:ATP-binding protein [Methylomirabilota bacterium]
MRLASKIFLGFSLVIVVLATVGVLGLRAVGRLVSVNREISSETLPALRLAGGVRDTLLTMARLEARFVVLRDKRYAELWRESAAHARADLTRLTEFAHTGPEAARLAAARAAFEGYHTAVLAEHNRLLTMPAAVAIGPDESPARRLGEQVESELEELQQATYARVLRAQTEVARLEKRTWNGVIVALATALVLALITTAVIALRITRSLRRLSVATAAVAAGSFRDPIPVAGNDEVAVLGRSFNAMADRLRQHDEMKEEFFATLSHELRSPITSVREAGHLLADGVPGPLTPKQARLVDIIRRSTDRLLRLVNQILDASRLRAGVLPLEHVPLDLDWLVGRAMEELRPIAEEGKVTLARERVGSRFTVQGDEDRLVQVVVNLLANAVRFTPVGGRVTVRLIDAGPECEIQVEDTGVGIPAHELPHVFESYRQAHPGKGGTGLGLAIVRGLVHAHGGRVTAESQEGKGSRFSVLLPRDRAA